VTINEFLIDNRIYLEKYTSRDYMSQITITQTNVLKSPCLVTAVNGGHFSASGITSLRGGDHLTPTSYSDRWLQPLAPGLDWLPTAKLELQLPTLNWLPSCTNSQHTVDCLCSPNADRIENTASNSSFIIAYIRYLVTALILLHVYTAAA
jgi:hypothetical protein